MRAVGTLLALVLGSAGCGEDLPPIRYETDKALIGTDFDLPLCERDLDRLDAQIRFVEDFLDAASDEKIEIYVYENQPPDCPGLGCWNTELGVVQTLWNSVDHEVVHAIVTRFASPPAFWSEGIAVALERNGTHEGGATVLDSTEVTDERQPNEVENSQTSVGLLFRSDSTHELNLTDGVYKVVVSTEADAEDVTVELHRVE